MDIDLDDLMDDAAPPGKSTTTVAQRHRSPALGRFGGGAKKDDLDDLGDSFDFDNAKNASKPASGTRGGMSFGGIHTGMSSAQNARAPLRNDDAPEDTFFGVGKGLSKKPLGRADSFGGGSRHGGSAAGSRKSQAEAEADDFDALLDEIVRPEPTAAGAAAPDTHMPTGTFRNSENDGWEDLNFGAGIKSPGLQATGSRLGSGGGYTYNKGVISSKKPLDDEDDIDNLLDNMAEERGIEPIGSTSKRP